MPLHPSTTEALHLDREDVDLDVGVLTIRNTKFGKSRQVPLHPSTVEALARYERHREELRPRPWTQSFFVTTRGNRPDKSNIEKVFRELRRRAELQGERGSPKPRLHDLRHSFAVRTVIDWHCAGIDVQPRLLWLSTYLGHVEPSDTYRYLTAAPELLALAAKRLETTLGVLR